MNVTLQEAINRLEKEKKMIEETPHHIQLWCESKEALETRKLAIDALRRINKNSEQIMDLGDTLYCVDEDLGCYNTTVKGIILMKDGEYEYQTPDGEFYREDVGKTVFLDIKCREHYYGS